MPSAETIRLSTRDIRLAVSIRARPERVYQALTSARELTRWWLLGAETDARNAGRVRMVWPRLRGAAGGLPVGFGERAGVFVDLEPARKVAWLWKPARGEKGVVPPLCSIFMLPGRRAGRSEISLLHSGFPSAKAVDGLFLHYARGWEDGLAKLKLYLEAGKTCKSELIDLESVGLLTKRRS